MKTLFRALAISAILLTFVFLSGALEARPGKALTKCAAITLTKCGAITKRGRYNLTADVSSSGTCFTLAVNDITLDLGGHTVTYGMGGGTSPSYGVQIDSKNVGGSFHSTVTNGHITQSSSAAPASHIFNYGDPSGYGRSNGTLHETISSITADIYTQDSGFFWTSYEGGGNLIHDIVINNHNTVVSNRDQLLGYAIHINNGSQPGTSDTFYNIVQNGGPQGGLFSNSAFVLHDSQFHLGPTQFVGGYCAFLSGVANEVYNVTCDGITRGFEIEGKNAYLHDSTVNVTDSAQVHDPGHNPIGCEIDGAYGIRVKSYNTTGYLMLPTGTRIGPNMQVTVNAGACGAQALRLTAIAKGETIAVSNSIFTEIGTSTANPSSAFSGAGDSDTGLAADLSGVTFSGNTFGATDQLLFTNWDGASNLNLTGTFRGSASARFVCGGANCLNNVITGPLPAKASLSCDPNHKTVQVSVNGKSLSCH